MKHEWREWNVWRFEQMAGAVELNNRTLVAAIWNSYAKIDEFLTIHAH
jgi:hypothetical protein